MSGYYMQYLESLCRRRGWQEPSYECYRDSNGHTCRVLVNGREYQTDKAWESDSLAQENAAMRAFMVCRNFSVNGGMLARNGIVQGLPGNGFGKRKQSRHASSSHTHGHSYHGSGHDRTSGRSSSSTRSIESYESTDTMFSHKSYQSSSSAASSVQPVNNTALHVKLTEVASASEQFKHALSEGNYNVVNSLLDDSFSEVATGEHKWLNELRDLGLSPKEIAKELLEKFRDGPCVFTAFDIPKIDGFAHDFHQNDCVHGSAGSAEISSRINTTRDTTGTKVGWLEFSNFDKDGRARVESPEGTNAAISKVGTCGPLSWRESIEYLCGIGGVSPVPTGQPELQFGSLLFEDDGSTAISFLYDLRQTTTILKQLELSSGILQQMGGCCDSFTFLWLQQSCAELIQTDLKVLQNWDRSSLRTTLRIPDSSQIETIIPQLLSLAFLSYSQAHCGPIRPFFIDTPLTRILLIGDGEWTADFCGPCVVGSLVDLSCFSAMVQQPVFAFQYLDHYDPETILSREPVVFDLLATSEDLLDTWGPGGFMASTGDTENLYAVSIGGGLVTRTSADPSMFHWSLTAQIDPLPSTMFHRREKVRIGAGVSYNGNCRAEPQKHLRIEMAVSMLEEIGTFPSYWEVSERQLGFGLQAGQGTIALLQFNQTWIKRHGLTKKSRMLTQRALYLADLESYFGIQVSICTGVAQRIRLRDLLADILPVYVGALVATPPGWKSLLEDQDLLRVLKEGDLRTWLDNLDHDLQRTFESLVVAILFLLQDTGVDRKAQDFIVGCIQPNLPFKCFKIPCRRENYWARMVADSEDIATFAYVTTQCLETGVVKCPGSHASWANSTGLFWTAVSCCQEERQLGATTAPSHSTIWTLKHSEAYLIGKPEAPLLVKVDRPDVQEEPRLLVSLSTIRPDILRRLYRRSNKLRRLRERGFFNQNAENVIVLASGGV